MKTNQLIQFSLQLSQLTARLPPEFGGQGRMRRPALKRLSPALQTAARRSACWLNRSKGWLLGGLGILLLWALLWPWLLALAVGLTVATGCYLAQQGQLRAWRGWQRLWSRANRSLSLSALAGLVATGSAYLALAIWIEAGRSWLAAGVILEGFGLLAILSLLVWRQCSKVAEAQPVSPDCLHQLSAADPLQRLIAIRQLTQLAQQANPPLAPAHLSECLRLMLDRELEPAVCHALIEGLRQLNSRPLSQPTEGRCVTPR